MHENVQDAFNEDNEHTDLMDGNRMWINNRPYKFCTLGCVYL